MMDLRKATLVKRQSGYFFAQDDAELGTEYIVDMDTKRMGTFQNEETGNWFEAEYVMVVEDGHYAGHMPMGLIEIEKLN